MSMETWKKMKDEILFPFLIEPILAGIIVAVIGTISFSAFCFYFALVSRIENPILAFGVALFGGIFALTFLFNVSDFIKEKARFK